MSNGIVEAYVVPRIGRIMAFQFSGHPETNPIFENPAWTATTPNAPGTWSNYGGDKLWVSPQSDWPKYLGHDWPPDVAFDGTPQSAIIISNGVQMVSADSSVFGLRSTRTITMDPRSARLNFTEILQRVAAPNGSSPSFTGTTDQKVGIWLVTQVRGDETIFVSFDGKGGLESQITPLNGSPPVQYPTWRFAKTMAIGGVDSSTYHKVGFGRQYRSIGALSGTTYFEERYSDRGNGPWPDNSPIQAFTLAPSDSTPAYMEIENLSPLAAIPVGDHLTFTGTWQLCHLPRAPVSDENAIQIIANLDR